MTPYKGIVKLSCAAIGRCTLLLTENVEPRCIGCPESVVEIVDLEGKKLFELKKLGRPLKIAAAANGGKHGL